MWWPRVAHLLAAAHAAADYAAEPAFAADDGAAAVGAARAVGALDEASSVHVDLPYRIRTFVLIDMVSLERPFVKCSRRAGLWEQRGEVFELDGLGAWATAD